MSNIKMQIHDTTSVEMKTRELEGLIHYTDLVITDSKGDKVTITLFHKGDRLSVAMV